MKLFFKRLLALFPTKIPTGLTEYRKWVDSVLELSDAPINDTNRGAVAAQVIHLSPQSDRKAKYYFIKTLNKGAANEIAHFEFQRIKSEMVAKARAAEELAAKQSQAEATAEKVVSDEQQGRQV